MKKAVSLRSAREIPLYGAKAVSLGEAARHGILIPDGIALSGDLVEAIASGDAKAIAKLMLAAEPLSPPFAVRSSVVGEDGRTASFAGQHLTRLNVHSTAELVENIREVWWSANSDLAITYRQRMGVVSRPSVGVIVQTLLSPNVAGVMFTENPRSGTDERMVEACYGLGESVVSGLGVPDNYRFDRSGHLIERQLGDKRIAIRPLPNGGTFEQEVEELGASGFCLNDKELA